MEQLGYFVDVPDVLSLQFVFLIASGLLGVIVFALGCIQALQYNQDTCPTGMTTHDPKLQRGLNPELRSVRVANYARNVLREVGVITHSCGFREPRQMQRFPARIVTESGRPLPLDEAHRRGQVNRIVTTGDPKSEIATPLATIGNP